MEKLTGIISQLMNNTWSWGFGHAQQSGTQFYHSMSHLGPFGWVCYSILLLVPSISCAVIARLLFMIYFKRVGFQKTLRLVVDRLMGIRRKAKKEPSGSTAPDSQVLQDTSAEVDDELFFTASDSDSSEEEVEKLGRLPCSATASCLCCKVRNVISVLFLGKLGSGDCLAKESNPSTTDLKVENMPPNGEINENVVLHPKQSKRMRVL